MMPATPTQGCLAKPPRQRCARLCAARCMWAVWQRVGRVLGMVLLALTVQGQLLAAEGAPPAKVFAPEELEALVAPVALYPDAVLSQVLMASTYPMEIVFAARWLKANPKLSGDEAVKAVQDQPWDVSVKSLVAFPQILEPMNEKLDWTQKLGDAFLAQNKDVMDAVQRLRARARQAGNLSSNAQQQVVEQPAQGASTTTVIRIEPTNPQVVYVPAYNPTVVYGSWAYPSYPPYYWPPSPAWYPGGALVSGFAWGVGLAAAGAIFSDCDWGRGDVNINVNKAANIDRNFDRTKVQQSGGRWQHDAAHRQGVAYRDNASRERYGRNTAGAEQRDAYRGRDTAGAQRTDARGDTRQRGAEGDRTLGGDDRGRSGERQQARGEGSNRDSDRNDRTDRTDRADRTDRTDRSQRAGADSGAGRAQAGSQDRLASTSRGSRDNAFQGVDRGGAAQRDFDRGRSSVQASSFGGGRR